MLSGLSLTVVECAQRQDMQQKRDGARGCSSSAAQRHAERERERGSESESESESDTETDRERDREIEKEKERQNVGACQETCYSSIYRG